MMSPLQKINMVFVAVVGLVYLFSDTDETEAKPKEVDYYETMDYISMNACETEFELNRSRTMDYYLKVSETATMVKYKLTWTMYVPGPSNNKISSYYMCEYNINNKSVSIYEI